MTVRSRLMAAISAIALLGGTAACTTNPETGERRIGRTAIGAGAGAAIGAGLGAIIGGRKNRTETIVGAGIGALAGGAIGNYMDRQEKRLREQTAGTGVDIVREGDELRLVMPSGLTFDYDSAIVKPQFRETLNQVATTLAEYNQTFVDVIGHTDADGSNEYNQALSERRADAVASYLATQGVVRQRIATQGLGEGAPVAANTSDEGKAQNRRVEIKLVPVTEQDVAAAQV